MNFLGFQKLQIRAAIVLKNTLFDEVKKVLVPGSDPLPDRAFCQGYRLIRTHSLLGEFAKPLDESIVLFHRKICRRTTPTASWSSLFVIVSEAELGKVVLDDLTCPLMRLILIDL